MDSETDPILKALTEISGRNSSAKFIESEVLRDGITSRIYAGVVEVPVAYFTRKLMQAKVNFFEFRCSQDTEGNGMRLYVHSKKGQDAIDLFDKDNKITRLSLVLFALIVLAIYKIMYVLCTFCSHVSNRSLFL